MSSESILRAVPVAAGSGAEAQWSDWHGQLAHGNLPLAAIEATGGGECGPLTRVAERYPVFATPYYRRVAVTCPAVARQFLPDVRELAEDGQADPFGETGSTGIPGLVHRFPDRILLVMTRACAVRCRHCTRKGNLGQLDVFDPVDHWDALEHYLQAHSDIREIILSGGDPLVLEDDALADLIGRVAAIPSIESLRVGTRVPVVLPMRVTDALCRVLRVHPSVWVNTHFNHPAELTAEALAACGRLVDAGILVSNQTVLLKGVNDDLATLRELCTGLQRGRVRPYYVFSCDPIAGIAHFRVSRERAVALERRLRESVGGLAMPLFVEDLPGHASKVPLHSASRA